MKYVPYVTYITYTLGYIGSFSSFMYLLLLNNVKLIKYWMSNVMCLFYPTVQADLLSMWTLLFFSQLLLTSYFAAVIMNIATRGPHLTRNINLGNNILPAHSTYIVVPLMRRGCKITKCTRKLCWIRQPAVNVRWYQIIWIVICLSRIQVI